MLTHSDFGGQASGGARLSRKSKWLCSDEELIERLEKTYGAKTTWNPREDRIPFDLIAAVVTERGIIDHSDEKKAKEQLSKQMEDVDGFLHSGSESAAAGTTAGQSGR